MYGHWGSHTYKNPFNDQDPAPSLLSTPRTNLRQSTSKKPWIVSSHFRHARVSTHHQRLPIRMQRYKTDQFATPNRHAGRKRIGRGPVNTISSILARIQHTTLSSTYHAR